ncbi:MAG: peptidoglycan DD-metalloendopeptidase family protein [Roseburia sp.]|nr:peptidoglycan DD-metalloendopeptidase family protein [Roseburia sp.]
MHSGRLKKIAGLALALVLAAQPVSLAQANSLEEAQQEKEKLEDALEEAQALIENLKGSKSDIQDKVTRLDAQLTKISTDISNLESQLEDKNLEISDTSKVLKEAEEDAAAQYEMMKVRIRYMYENRDRSYVEQLLSARSISDLLNAVEYISQITRYDRQMLDKYQKTQVTVKDAKTALEQEKAELEQMQAKVEENRQAVSVLLTAKESELTAVNQDIKTANSQADAFEAELIAQEEVIAQIRAAEEAKRAARAKAEAEAKAKAEAEAAAAAAAAAQEAEQDGTEEPVEPQEGESETSVPVTEPEPESIPEDTYNGGAFLWPCPASTRITSDYGNRESPTAGASSNHKGIDIGAPYGSDIVAAADGDVIFAGYSNGGGNYVMIDHGGSLYTVYMHASSLCVSKGDKVTRGQTVAKVGSTGISTGNHLHFGVSLNGAYVSPWNYLSR